MSNLKYFLTGVSIVIIMGLGALFVSDQKKQITKSNTSSSIQEKGSVAGAATANDGDYMTRLAKNLAEKGMVLYGSYTCTDCQKQKDMFGDAAQYLDYVECDAAGPNANPDECQSQQVMSYPTWVYDGKQYSGVLELSDIAKIVGFTQ